MISNHYRGYHHKCPRASLPSASRDDAFGNSLFHLAIGQIADANIVEVSTAGAALRSMGPAMSFHNFPAVVSSAHARRVRLLADHFFVSGREEISRQDGSCLHDRTARRAPSRSLEWIA